MRWLQERLVLFAERDLLRMGGYKGGWIRTLKSERKKNGKIKMVDFKHADHMMNFLNLN